MNWQTVFGLAPLAQTKATMSYGGGPGGPNNYGQPQQRSSVVFGEPRRSCMRCCHADHLCDRASVGNLPFDYTEEQLTEVGHDNCEVCDQHL